MKWNFTGGNKSDLIKKRKKERKKIDFHLFVVLPVVVVERFDVDVGIIKPRGRTKYVVILPLPLTNIGPRHSHG
jgi:hypothetical protein